MKQALLKHKVSLKMIERLVWRYRHVIKRTVSFAIVNEAGERIGVQMTVQAKPGTIRPTEPVWAAFTSHTPVEGGKLMPEAIHVSQVIDMVTQAFEFAGFGPKN